MLGWWHGIQERIRARPVPGGPAARSRTSAAPARDFGYLPPSFSAESFHVVSSAEFPSGRNRPLAPETSGTYRLRRLLFVLTLVGTAGLAAELVLLEHVDSWTQWIPVVALALGLASGVAVAIAPAPRTFALFRLVMMMYVGAGLLGLYLHYRGNVEFEREEDPSLAGLALVWRSLRGATPTLAPGALAQLGLLGLLFAWRHPATAGPAAEGASP